MAENIYAWCNLFTSSAKKIKIRTESFSYNICYAEFKIRAYVVRLPETAYSQSKQSVISTSGYNETVYRDFRKFMQLIQCFDDSWALIINLIL